MRIALLAFEKDAEKLGEIEKYLKIKYETQIVIYRKEIWKKLLDYDCIVAYMPTGVVIRGLCPYLRSKWIDPAVVLIDRPMMHAIPILGGHHGGNDVAYFLEGAGLKAIVTTAMEFSSGLSVGVGFREKISSAEILNAIKEALGEIGYGVADIRAISTVEDKKGSEILGVADILKKPLIFVKREEINSMELRETSARLIGVKNVCEACAIFSSNYGELLLPKRVYGGVTVAIAR
jgi:cobalt-precorrin 5A hydrolase